jgi:hypothetical protein
VNSDDLALERFALEWPLAVAGEVRAASELVKLAVPSCTPGPCRLMPSTETGTWGA